MKEISNDVMRETEIKRKRERQSGERERATIRERKRENVKKERQKERNREGEREKFSTVSLDLSIFSCQLETPDVIKCILEGICRRRNVCNVLAMEGRKL